MTKLVKICLSMKYSLNSDKLLKLAVNKVDIYHKTQIVHFFNVQ